MTRINSRSKGIRGERIVIDWLQPIVDAIYAEFARPTVLLQRNTIQSDKGGSDIHGLYWLAAEVKNVANSTPGELEKHWQQCNEQWMEGQTPVLFYIIPRRGLRVRMMGWVGGHVSCAEEKEPDYGCTALVDISQEHFEIYFRERLRAELTKKKRAYA